MPHGTSSHERRYNHVPQPKHRELFYLGASQARHWPAWDKSLGFPAPFGRRSDVPGGSGGHATETPGIGGTKGRHLERWRVSVASGGGGATQRHAASPLG